MSTNETPTNGSTTTTLASPPDDPTAFVREKLTKKAVTADHPTWCPGCPECFRGAPQTTLN
jgi:2-oxoglutarate/2-oxoacid ferredoxin oxidoreductase subunit beta